MRQFGVIADDLTGSVDTGLQFRRAGLRTVVRFALPLSAEGDAGVDVLVLDTDSREDPSDVAYDKVRSAARWLSGRAVYKKIDSTLRGNVGQELDALMDQLELERALVTPAFPANGRTVVQGRLSVRGVPLRQTDFVEDRLCPPTDHIPTLLSGQSRRSVGHIGLGMVDGGTQVLIDEIGRRTEEILVIDASRHSHLVVIAAAAACLGNAYLLSGSAGLARALPDAFEVRIDGTPSTRRTGYRRPVLVVAGSRRAATARQIRTAVSAGAACLVEIDPVDLERTTHEAVLRAKECAIGGLNVVLTPAFRPYAPEKSDAVARNLGDIAAEVAASQQPAGLILTGGATAFSVCRALDIQAIEIDEEIAPGIPAGRVLEGSWEGMKLVTKAGGFGEEDILLRAINYLRGEDA